MRLGPNSLRRAVMDLTAHDDSINDGDRQAGAEAGT
jgi:hypothetical protein